MTPVRSASRAVLRPVDRSILPSRLALALSGLLFVAARADAQHAHQGMEHATHTMAPAGTTPPALSAKTRDQIAAVQKAVAGFSTEDTLRAEGFRPIFGMIPTMGTHWVSVGRMLDSVTLLEPEQLMFSKVNGKQQLVGVAYAFLGQADQAPDLFDGDGDQWHAHPDLAPQGLSAVMLHVWFVPSPDGPFAGHNPWLPYWAAGVEPPADSALLTPESASRARRLGLALAEAVEPMNLVQAKSNMSPLEMAVAQAQGNVPPAVADSELPPAIQAARDSLRAEIPRLNAARQKGDQAAWDREADAAITTWQGIRDEYIALLPPERREGMAKFYRQMETGGHEH